MPEFTRNLMALARDVQPVSKQLAALAPAAEALALELAQVPAGRDTEGEAQIASAALGLLAVGRSSGGAMVKTLPGSVLGRFDKVPQPLRLKAKAINEPAALTPDEVLHRTMASKNHQHQLNARPADEREAFMAAFKRRWVGDRPYVRTEVDLAKLDRRPFTLVETKVAELVKAPPRADGNYPIIAPNESASDHPHLILDGNHRVEAALRRGDATMTAYVHEAIAPELAADTLTKSQVDVKASVRHSKSGAVVQVRQHTMAVDKKALIDAMAQHMGGHENVPDHAGLHEAIDRALDQHHEAQRLKHVRYEAGAWRTSNTKPAAAPGAPQLHVGGGKIKLSVGGELKHHVPITHDAPSPPARDKVGQGNTGDVHRDGDEVVKNARRGGVGDVTLEGEVYEKLKGVPGIAAGRQVGDEIRLPYYPQVLSIDTTVGENRTQYADLIRANAARINGAIAALSEAGYDYADPLQFGVKDGVMDLLDFSNVRAPKHSSDGVPRLDNRGLLGTFYSTFGCEDLARKTGAAEGALGQINRITRAEEKTGAPSELMRKVGDKTMGAHVDRMKAELGGLATHSYVANSPPGALPTGATHFEDQNGTHVVLATRPLDPAAIAKHGLLPIYHPPDAHPAPPAHAGKTMAEHPPQVGDVIHQKDDPEAPPARVVEVGKDHVKVVPDGMIDTFHVGRGDFHTMAHTGENKGQLDWRERAPAPGLDKIGEGSGGPVFGDGKHAWKRPMGEEAAAYAAVAGTPGIAPAKQEAGGWISMPHYPSFIHGLDDRTTETRAAIKANAGRIRGALEALTAAGYSYGDTPQFGVTAAGAVDLLDLGNARHVGVTAARDHNDDIALRLLGAEAMRKAIAIPSELIAGAIGALERLAAR